MRRVFFLIAFATSSQWALAEGLAYYFPKAGFYRVVGTFSESPKSGSDFRINIFEGSSAAFAVEIHGVSIERQSWLKNITSEVCLEVEEPCMWNCRAKLKKVIRKIPSAQLYQLSGAKHLEWLKPLASESKCVGKVLEVEQRRL